MPVPHIGGPVLQEHLTNSDGDQACFDVGPSSSQPVDSTLTSTPCPLPERGRQECIMGVPANPYKLDFLADQSSSARIWRQLCILGEGASGVVWLCDWQSSLKPLHPQGTICESVNGPRRVAVKRIKRPWTGSVADCMKLKELESLLRIPRHKNIIDLYDFFFSPTSCELFMVFEVMEGNLHQLLKRRRLASQPLTHGLIFSIFRQIVTGLQHIHMSGYIHRDLKPENLLVSPANQTSDFDPPIPRYDVALRVKISDFGLSREAHSSRPYTDYIATRWYRPPEVLLHDQNYSMPVDLWALGLLLVELVTLKALFTGRGELEQLSKICQVLGDPSEDHGLDGRGRAVGGGPWPAGLRRAQEVGFIFKKAKPVAWTAVMQRTVPQSLVDCVSDLLRYDPDSRLTASGVMKHPYMTDMGRPAGGQKRGKRSQWI